LLIHTTSYMSRKLEKEEGWVLAHGWDTRPCVLALSRALHHMLSGKQARRSVNQALDELVALAKAY
jgi:hypothetical protein